VPAQDLAGVLGYAYGQPSSKKVYLYFTFMPVVGNTLQFYNVYTLTLLGSAKITAIAAQSTNAAANTAYTNALNAAGM
jgi:hypothetical protein